jgi:hypothetical protein
MHHVAPVLSEKWPSNHGVHDTQLPPEFLLFSAFICRSRLQARVWALFPGDFPP